MCVVYVLKLEDEKYYVGQSENASLRIDVYFGDDDSKKNPWTVKYKPISIIEVIPECDEYEGDKYVLRYMKTYGVDNVRGCTFNQVVLPASSLLLIDRMIKDIKEINDTPTTYEPPTTQITSESSEPCIISEVLSYIQSVVMPEQCDYCCSEEHKTIDCKKINKIEETDEYSDETNGTDLP